VIDLGKVGGRTENSMPYCQAPRVPDFLTVEFTPSNDNCAPASQLMNFHEGSGESFRSTAPGGPFGLLSFFRRGLLPFNWQEHLLLPCRGLAGFLGFRGFACNRYSIANPPLFGETGFADSGHWQKSLTQREKNPWTPDNRITSASFARSQPDANQCPVHAR